LYGGWSATKRIAEHALVPPVVNTSPLPKYDYDKLDYGMTIGIERTPGGRRQSRCLFRPRFQRPRRRDLVEPARRARFP